MFVPDEEIGGFDGMKKFIAGNEFLSLNAGLVIDEGLANPLNRITVFYGERAAWWITVEARGNTGHGSQFIKDTATEKLVLI